MAQVRYIVENVDQAIAFYVGDLGFQLVQQFGPAMAIVEQGDLRLWLAGPAASASRPMPDGEQPHAGGWARLVLTVEELDETISRLRDSGVRFRNETVVGPGGRQILCLDPSGNLVELFQPA